MKEAIQKAIEGGFRNERGLTWEYVEKHYSEYEKESLLLRATFWQALGKAMGWEEGNSRTYWSKESPYKVTLLDRWENEMHSFIDHLIQGDDPESFFNSLLN